MKPGVFLVFLLASTQSFPQHDFENDYFVPAYQRKYENGLGIIGGQDASPNQFPYQVGIYAYSATSTNFCGGSLVSENYVLTAAHCTDGVLKMDLVFGAQNISDESEATQIRISSTQFIAHENWNPKKFANDVALIKLSTPIKETEAIKIIPISSGNDTYSDKQGIVSGWGKTQDDQVIVTEILKYITTPILSNADCSKAGSSYAKIMNPTLLCISGAGPVGTCGGDSGGPLVVDGVQVGVVSFGYRTCTAGKPSVFARLNQYRDWIVRNSDVEFADV